MVFTANENSSTQISLHLGCDGKEQEFSPYEPKFSVCIDEEARSKINKIGQHKPSSNAILPYANNIDILKNNRSFPTASGIAKLLIILVLCSSYHNLMKTIKASEHEISEFAADFNNVRATLEGIKIELHAADASFRNLKFKNLSKEIDDEIMDDVDNSISSPNMSIEEREHVAKKVIDKNEYQEALIGVLKKNIQDFHRGELERR
jgi:hypothetical protein